MNRGIGGVLVAAVLVVGLAGTCLAGAMYRNNSGAVARAIRIEFSEPAEITSMWPNFPQREPQGPATVVVLSGGELPAGGWFSLTWRPDSARVVKVEWLTSSGPTFEEIMARIAKYPGPDEPLYEPRPDEAIWLTDLEGHADIYDNDSIKINYAPWFDQSQITRIEVYRNGVRMRFLPEKFDVLTNEQMKTFDGNPLEQTPASAHTDHAVWGYEYQFAIATKSSLVESRTVRVVNPVKVGWSWRTASLGNYWYGDMPASDEELDTYINDIGDWGFNTVQIDVNFFMKAKDSSEVFAQYTHDPSITPDWARTATQMELHRMILAVRRAGLSSELRLQIQLSEDFVRSYPGWVSRSAITPLDIGGWFQSWGDICVQMAAFAEDQGVDVLCIGVELNSMEQHEEGWRRLIARVRDAFTGRITFSQSTHHYLHGFNTYSAETRFSENVGKFWDECDIIGMNCYPLTEQQTTRDPRLGDLVVHLVTRWQRAVSYYRERYPGIPLVFAEMGTIYRDGAATHGTGGREMPDVMDVQEFADTWAAFLIGAAYLGVDGISAWAVRVTPRSLRRQWLRPQEYALNYTHVVDLVATFLR